MPEQLDSALVPTADLARQIPDLFTHALDLGGPDDGGDLPWENEKNPAAVRTGVTATVERAIPEGGRTWQMPSDFKSGICCAPPGRHWEAAMTNEISIYAEPGGFDSRLFFPATLLAPPRGASISPTQATYYYSHAGKQYSVEFQGSSFAGHDRIDFSGYATSAKINLIVDDVRQTLATVTIFLDAQHNTLGVPINSAAWMTPDNLITGLADFGGGHLSYLGNTGADKLFGSNYADYFNGENGHDRMTGYGGNDEFLFDALGKDHFDHITDFAHGHDTILLDHSDDGLFGGVTNSNLSKTFHDITQEAEYANDRILYDRGTGKLFYDEDGKGGAAPIIFAVLDNHAKLDIRDFDVV